MSPADLLRRSPELGLLVAIVVAGIVIYVLEPSFYGGYSLKNFLHETALYGVLALGATIVIISGGIDLSVGSVVALSAVVAGRLMRDWLPGAASSGETISLGVVVLAVVLTLALGCLVGIFHALDDQSFAVAAVHCDAGDDGGIAEPGEPDQQERDHDSV